MQRITITLDDALMAELDQLIEAHGYQSRSEAVRDLTRAGIQQALLEMSLAPEAIAALVYVYDHGVRELAARLTELFHAHHDLAVATMHCHLNHETCMEMTMLKGPTDDIKQLANGVLTERGVRHGKVVILPAVTDDTQHRHGTHAGPHKHIRTR